METSISIKDKVLLILDRHREDQGRLIAVLEEIQRSFGYLPKEALETVASKTGQALTEVYGLATFYKSFRLKPRGKHFVSICMGTACHVRGAPMIVDEFCQQLKIKVGETTEDKKFTLETVNCLGACALGPVVVIDGHYFPKVKKQNVKKLIERTLAGFGKLDIKKDKRIFPVDVSCPRCNHTLMDPTSIIDNHPSVRVTVSGGQKHGWFRLSALYGSYNVKSEHKFPEDTIFNVFCPHCHQELTGTSLCSRCSAPMLTMLIRKGGSVHICSALSCNNHLLSLR